MWYTFTACNGSMGGIKLGSHRWADVFVLDGGIAYGSGKGIEHDFEQSLNNFH